MSKNSVIMKCCVCQRVKTDQGWNYQFMTAEDGRVFSHGYCPLCYRQAMRDLEDETVVEALQLTH